MKDKDVLRIKQLEEALKPFRKAATSHIPHGGWLRAIREALGMTNVQLARRLKKAPQSLEDIQKSELNGTIQLDTLREVARGLGCQVVYAVVPPSSLSELRRERARQKAIRSLSSVLHSMKLEEQGLGAKEEQRQIELLIQRLLAGSPRKLWD